MKINTASKELLLTSVCHVLHIHPDECNQLLEDCFNRYQKDHPVFILDDQYDYFIKYSKEHLCVKVDNIPFYHIARKLNDDLDFNGYSLIDVLCKDTSLSRFLKKYGITFQYDRIIKMYVNGEEAFLNDHHDDSTLYLKQLFAYDYSFKGFVFQDAIEKNNALEMLADGPVFLGHLFSFMDSDALIEDFEMHSTYYLLEYLVPLKQVYFENYEELTDEEKPYHIIAKMLQRLYCYRYDLDFIANDEENPIIAMIDDQVLSKEYFVSKQEIHV